MQDTLQQLADSNAVINATIDHLVDSIMHHKFVSKPPVYHGKNVLPMVLAVSTVVIIFGSFIGYMIFNNRYWERGIFPPYMLNRRINHFEAVINLATNIIRCDRDGYAEKQALLLAFMRRKFPDIDGGVVHSMKLALGNPLTTESITFWLNKRLKHPEERLELLDFLFALSTLDGQIGQLEYKVMKTYSDKMGINQAVLDDRWERHRRARAERLHREQQENRQQHVVATSNYRKEQALDMLGLPAAFTPEALKKAYRSLAKKYHPDKFQQASEVEKQRIAGRFMEIQQAYEYLTEHS